MAQVPHQENPMNRCLTITTVLLAFSLSALAQQAASPANPVSQSLRDLESRSAKNMVAAAEAMPADKYDYHPTPAQMSYAHLILHISQSNTQLCSKISGQPAPQAEQLADTAGKDKLVTAIKASFDYCGQVLANVDDSGLGNMITLFGNRQATKAAAMFGLANDWADHYSTQAAYLRMNGILPPTAPQPRQ
jgi:uncharacterized damage-inducible protein DinB